MRWIWLHLAELHIMYREVFKKHSKKKEDFIKSSIQRPSSMKSLQAQDI